MKALLYLHGNYGNVGDNAAHAARLSRFGVNVLIPDYRGFGESSGPFPSESRVYGDAETAWQWQLHEKHYAPAEIVIYGTGWVAQARSSWHRSIPTRPG